MGIFDCFVCYYSNIDLCVRAFINKLIKIFKGLLDWVKYIVIFLANSMQDSLFDSEGRLHSS